MNSVETVLKQCTNQIGLVTWKENELCQQQDEQPGAQRGEHRVGRQVGPMPGQLGGRHAGQPGAGRQGVIKQIK